MKYLVTILTILILLMVSGCMSAEERYYQQRMETIAYLQRNFPDTWQDKLFQYDLEYQQRLDAARRNAVTMWNYNFQQSQNRLYGRPRW